MEPLNNKFITRIRRDLDQGFEVSVRTAKKDRGFSMVKLGAGYRLREDGFVEQVLEAEDWTAAKRLIKQVLKREFPRSRRVHYQQSR